ncbi:hypothetical protein [Spirosoma harenae]
MSVVVQYSGQHGFFSQHIDYPYQSVILPGKFYRIANVLAILVE